jgi:16S rRNA (guanine966-N2)-methyltransferase
MRINSGILGRRNFEVPKDGLRPTMEQAREAVFSSLAARVPGARVLDLFAGSGSFGLEAWSRGAASVTAVEKVSKHWKILQGNFQSLEGDPDLGDWQAVHADVYDYLKKIPRPPSAATEGRSVGAGGDRADAAGFDLVFADPPYEEADLPKLLEALRGVLAPDGLLVFEMRAHGAYSLPPEWILIKEKRYGGTRMLYLELVK